MDKMKQLIFKRGQSLTEVVLIIGIVSLVFIGMEVYFKRGLSGKLKDLTDNWIGKEHKFYQEDTSGSEEKHSKSNLVSSSQANVNEKTSGGKSLQANESAEIIYSSTTKE